MIIAEVIPISSSITTESLSYFSAKKIKPGDIVSIPLRKQEVKGIVLSVSEVKNQKQNLRQQNFKIRNIIHIYDENIFSQSYLKTIHHLKDYFFLHSGRFISLTYPRYILNNIPLFTYKTKKKYNNKNKKNEFSLDLVQKSFSERIKFYQKEITQRLKNNESVHIICPTELHIRKVVSVIDEENIPLFFLHGKSTKKKIEKTYQDIQQKVNVCISTTHFIDIPQKNKTSIIIEKDSSPFYKQVNSPHIDLRIFIEIFAQYGNYSLTIADSFLRPSRFQYKNIKKKYISQQIYNSKKISIIPVFQKQVDKKSDKARIQEIQKQRKFSPFTNDVLEKIQLSIQKKEHIFLFTRRKSLSPTVVCRDCGNLVQDPITKTPYSLYGEKKDGTYSFYYINRINGKIIPAFDTCQFCGSYRLESLGIGTETIREALKKKFPNIESYIIDSYNTKNNREIKKVLKEFYTNSSSAKVLIGTQKALPFLKNIDTSFVISMDGIFHQTSLFLEEKIFYLITEIYENTKKNIYIQTRNYQKEKNVIEIKQITNNNKEINPLQKKISNRLKQVLENITLTKEVGKVMQSRYSNALNIWETIETGNYQSFLKNYKDPNITTIKISHRIKKNIYQKYKLYYQQLYSKHSYKIKHTFIDRNNILLFVFITIPMKKWNPYSQDKNILNLIDINNHNIHIEINPDIL